MIRIAVDAMGGDRAPGEVVAGALEAASPQITPVLVGPAGLETGGLELVEATNPESEELRTPYLDDDRLDLSAWARDAVALALPEQILCRADCAGLCPVCGKDLNAEPHTHDEEQQDSRWAALADLRDRL